MGLATIGMPFDTPEELASWSFSHEASHVDLQRVIFNKHGTNIALYALDPFQPTGTWLYQNQIQHDAIAKVLNLQTVNLTNVDWQDEQSVAQWINLHFDAHQQASTALGLA
jgi:hypothetical protein